MQTPDGKVLLVDDDPKLLDLYRLYLEEQFAVDTALGGEQALAKIESNRDYAALVADMQMSGMNGIQFLVAVQERAPDTVRIMLTGNADQKLTMEAINKGHVFRFLTKPCAPSMLSWALEAGVKQYRLVTAERELLEKTLSGSIKVLMEILSMAEPQIFSRTQKLRDNTRRLAQHLKLSQTWDLELAALLSQIGYMAIPAGLHKKSDAGAALSSTENQMLARVPEMGSNLLAHIPRLEAVAQIVLFQRKNFDGTGFPDEPKAGEAIPYGARLLRILEDMIALEARDMPMRRIFDQLRTRPGQYDPKLLDAACECFTRQNEGLQPGQKITRAVRVKELEYGQKLLTDVVTREGLLIITAGNEISPMLLMRLRNFAELSGIKEPIYVEMTV